MAGLLAVFAEFERDILRERVKAGITRLSEGVAGRRFQPTAVRRRGRNHQRCWFTVKISAKNGVRMNISYREATVEDAEGIAIVEVVSQQVGYRAFLPATHLDSMSIRNRTSGWRDALQSDDPDRTVVAVYQDAVHQDKVVGFVRAGKHKDAGAGGITYLFVLPEYWGTGVGQALMSKATDILRDFGVVSAQLYAYRDNARGRRFYERLGWKPDGRTYDHVFDGKIFPLLCYVRTVEAEQAPGQPDVPATAHPAMAHPAVDV